uniref:Uncharacterized protein n=1 Tax=Arundo donax TaxID=35708 RepID=A0A0A9ERW3_ARUDO
MMTSPLFLLILKALVTFFLDSFVYISQYFGPCLYPMLLCCDQWACVCTCFTYNGVLSFHNFLFSNTLCGAKY